jgi:hypothetical protein
MKTLNILIFTFIISFGLHAQTFESKQELSVGLQNAYAMDHPKADKKQVEKALENAVKEYGKVKRNKKAKEWYCEECKIPTISPNQIKVYYKIEEGKGQTTSYLFFDDGGKFLSSENSDKQDAIKRLNTTVYNDVQKMVIGEELKSEEDNLKDRQKELEKLEKKNKDLHKDIEEYKEKISKAESEIEQNLQEQEDKKIEIEQQKNKVGSVTDKLNNVGRSN